jgi:hypothetical protein
MAVARRSRHKRLAGRSRISYGRLRIIVSGQGHLEGCVAFRISSASITLLLSGHDELHVAAIFPCPLEAVLGVRHVLQRIEGRQRNASSSGCRVFPDSPLYSIKFAKFSRPLITSKVRHGAFRKNDLAGFRFNLKSSDRLIIFHFRPARSNYHSRAVE